MPQIQDNSLSPDKPLIDPTKDRLNFAGFANSLADSICKMIPQNEGLVLGLYGAWGSGKSTLIEYVLHYLEQKPNHDKPIVIRFNPWWFSGQEHLVRHFFDQLYATFTTSNKEQLKKVGRLLKNFGEILYETDLPGIKVAKPIVDRIPFRERKDVPTLKSEVARILREHGKRVLVVIDDIDRLNPDEIREVFGLIKAVADFPNVIYLLAFDKEAVARSLAATYNISGDGFIEKIVQVSFEIPIPSKDELGVLLRDKLSGIFAGKPPRRLFGDAYLTPYPILQQMLSLMSTPRDVIRLANTVAVTHAAVAGEVDPADFVLIQALQVFCPDVYDLIRNNKGFFVGYTSFEEDRAFYEQFSLQQPKSVKAIVHELFPLSRPGKSWVNVRARQELRISSPDIFDVYFRMSIPSSSVSRQQILNIIRGDEEKDELAKFFDSTSKDDFKKCRQILERIPDCLEQITERRAVTLIGALLDAGDSIIDSVDKPLDMQAPIGRVMSNLILDLLGRISEPERYITLEAALRAAKSSYLALFVCVNAGQLNGKYGSLEAVSEEYRILKLEDVTRLEQIALEKILMIANSVNSYDNRKLRTVLHWWSYIDPDAAKQWTQTTIVNPAQLLEFIKEFMSPIRDIWLNEDLQTLCKYFDLGWLRQHIASYIEQGELSETHLEIANSFLKATKNVEAVS